MASGVSAARAEVERLRATVVRTEAIIRDALSTASGALDCAHEHAVRTWTALSVQSAAIVARGRPEHYADWADSRWDAWACEPHLPGELRVGELEGLGLPATVPLFSGRAVVFATESEAGAVRARAALRALAVRAAASLGSRGTLHLIDPFQEGFGFPERVHLPQDAPRGVDAVADLRTVVEQAARFVDRYQAVPYHDLPAGVQATEAAHLVLALDFPRGYSHQAVEYLNRIAQLGPAGVQLVVHHDLAAGPPGMSTDLILSRPVVVELSGSGQATAAWGRLTATIDSAPPTELVRLISERLPIPAPMGGEPTVLPWSAVNEIDPAGWWAHSAVEQATAVFGRRGDAGPLELAFGQDSLGESRAHAVVAGDTGSGKGVLLNSVILSLATRYPPDELRFYLVDGQNGVTMQAYSELPHADLVSLHTPIDLARGVLVDVGAELTRRDALLTSAGVDSLAAYWRVAGKDAMPRLIVVIDEYQSLFEGDRRDEAAAILLRISAQGRKVGLHLLLASQRFHATGLLNQNALFNNIRTRISLRLPTDAIDTVDEFDSEGRALIRAHCTSRGKVVVNAEGGRAGASVAGVVAYADDSARDRLISDLVARAGQGAAHGAAELLNGRQQPRPARSHALARLASVDSTQFSALAAWAEADARSGGLAVADWQAYDHPFAFVTGRTFSVYGSAFAKVDRLPAHNVVLVASDPEVLTGMTVAGLVSAAMSVARGRLTVVVASELPPPGSWQGMLSDELPDLLSARGHAAFTAESAGAAVRGAVDELNRRAGLTPIELADAGPYLLVAVSLDRMADFQKVEGRYGPEPSVAGADLARVLREGPQVGVHAVLGFTTAIGWARVLPDKAHRLFVHRFFQQLSEDDSRSLLDNSLAHRVSRPGIAGPQRAGYHHRDSGVDYVLLPYTTGGSLLDELRQFVNPTEARRTQ